MTRLANGILHYKKTVLTLVLLIAAASTLAIPFVHINYDLTDYLPDEAESTQAVRMLDETFAEGIPNLNVYLPDVSIPEALEYKAKLAELPGVSDVFWLDDVADVYAPLETQDSSVVEAWYRDGGALLLVTADTGQSVELVAALRELTGNCASSPDRTQNFAYIQVTTMGRDHADCNYGVPLVLLILLFSTRSWLRPLLFLGRLPAWLSFIRGHQPAPWRRLLCHRASSAILQLASP